MFMANSSSLSRALIIVPLVAFATLLLWSRPELVAERAEASTREPTQTYADVDATSRISLFPVSEAATSSHIEVTTPEDVAPEPTPAPAPIVKPVTKTLQAAPQPSARTVSVQAAPEKRLASAPITPARLSIPHANIDKRIIGVGINDKGEMDVPSGSTDNVGWYSPGVKPGAPGTAVMDAHVYAAFKDLSHVSVGNDVYVSDAHGNTLHFRVTKVTTYLLSDLTSAMLFSGYGTSGSYLNFITCAGTYDTVAATYDHRLIVFAELVD